MTNPLINETTKVKIKKKFGRKNQELSEMSSSLAPIDIQLIGMNNAIPICAEACACCWDKPIPENYADIAEYVAKRSRIGHTSVLEHSNIIFYINISTEYDTDFIEFMAWCKYVTIRQINVDINRKVIIGGSFRAFADIYRECDNLNNPILKAITGQLYIYGNSAAFEDICKLGLLTRERFMDVEPDENFNMLTDENTTGFETELFKIVGIDSIKKLYTNIYKIDKDLADSITTSDLIRFATLSVLFKNMSRTCTHQLVRHRNAITQESQRYVDYSQACFSSPDAFKPDKYDSDHRYTIRFGTSAPMHLTLAEIGKAMCDVYGMLHNAAITGNGHALLKEDARAFLPGNVQCKKIYMTFTYKNFFKFLDLREDPSAQAEIRLYASELGKVFRKNTEFNTKDLIELYTMPRLLIAEDPYAIEVVDEKDEIVELSEKDILKSVGLESERSIEINIDNIENGGEV